MDVDIVEPVKCGWVGRVVSSATLREVGEMKRGSAATAGGKSTGEPASKRGTTKPSRKRKADDSEQYERFRQFAREHGADESPEAFERAFRKIVPPKAS